MGYECRKVRQRPDGSIYWAVYFTDRTGGQKKQHKIRNQQLHTIGITPSLTYEEAKARIHQINELGLLKKAEERKKIRTIARLDHSRRVSSAFLPPLDVTEFEKRILFKKFARDEESLKFRRLLSHWTYVQKMIAQLQLDPSDYHEECHQIFQYFEEKQTSPEYANKILRIINAWGYFYCKKMSKPFLAIPNPRGREKQRIVDAYQDKPGYRGQTEGLTPEALESAKPLLLEYNYNWLFLSVWLGLRSQEIDSLVDSSKWKLETQNDVSILWVYQSKLMSVAKDKRWKPIPLILPQQEACLNLIKQANFKRPLNKTLRRIFPGKRIRTYSGRKAFVDLMLKYDQAPENISVWLGHSSIDTTWAHYKDKQKVNFKKIA